MIKLSGMSYGEIKEHTEKVIEQLRLKAYGEGYEQGKFDAIMDAVQAEAMVGYEASETAQEARNRIVERAKADLEDVKQRWNVPGNPMRYLFDVYVCTEEFIVSKEKRTVVCILRWDYNNSIVSRGIAKCAPNDCFNAHIGKAIALRRALGLEVPDEYLNAPQPTEVRVGDVIKSSENYYEIQSVDKKGRHTYVSYKFGRGSSGAFIDEKMKYKIIDDSRDGGE